MQMSLEKMVGMTAQDRVGYSDMPGGDSVLGMVIMLTTMIRNIRIAECGEQSI